MQRAVALVSLSSPATRLLLTSEEIVFSCHPSLAHGLEIDGRMVLQLARAHFTLRANRYANRAIICIDQLANGAQVYGCWLRVESGLWPRTAYGLKRTFALTDSSNSDWYG